MLFWSQHEEAVRACADEAVEVSLLRDTRTPDQLERFLNDAERLGAHGISASWSQVSPGLAKACSRRNLSLYAWCKRKRIEADKLALLRGIVTDWPIVARAAVAEPASLRASPGLPAWWMTRPAAPSGSTA